MSRQHVRFTCEGATEHGTIDKANGKVGLLVVSGGNEIRSGAFGGQAMLARRVSDSGFPVFRFDRRGVGDSEGENRGFRHSAPDIAAAIAQMRVELPHVERIVGFGNCDAASALMMHGGCGCDALVLANPWTFDADDAVVMSREAVRARYASKLRNPREWLRAMRGGVSFRKFGAGLKAALKPEQSSSHLLEAMRSGIAGYDGPLAFLVSGRDRTGQAFQSSWGADARIAVRESADHAFSFADDFDWLADRLTDALDEQARQLDMG